MYLNEAIFVFPKVYEMFNYNMGCIWIAYLDSEVFEVFCLTITWDVFEWDGEGIDNSKYYV